MKILWEKFRDSYFSKFVFVGILNTAIGYGLFVLFIYLHFQYILASVVSFMLSVANSYLWNKFFTFQTSGKNFFELAKFFTVYFIQYLIGLFGLIFLVQWVKIRPIPAQTFLLMIMTLFSFFSHKHWTFRNKT